MFRRNWREPGYWRWWWANQAPPATKLMAAFGVAAALAFGGFLVVDNVAGASPTDSVAGALYTVTREHATTVREAGKPVRVIQQVTVQKIVYRTQTQTSPRNEVTVAGPARTVVAARTVVSPGETVVRTQQVPITQVRTQTARRTVTRRQTVTTPGAVVPTTVTATQVQTQTQTVTRTTTVSQKRPVTVTVPVTVPSTITIIQTTIATVTETKPAKTVTVTVTTTGP